MPTIDGRTSTASATFATTDLFAARSFGGHSRGPPTFEISILLACTLLSCVIATAFRVNEGTKAIARSSGGLDKSLLKGWADDYIRFVLIDLGCTRGLRKPAVHDRFSAHVFSNPAQTSEPRSISTLSLLLGSSDNDMSISRIYSPRLWPRFHIERYLPRSLQVMDAGPVERNQPLAVPRGGLPRHIPITPKVENPISPPVLVQSRGTYIQLSLTTIPPPPLYTTPPARGSRWPARPCHSFRNASPPTPPSPPHLLLRPLAGCGPSLASLLGSFPFILLPSGYQRNACRLCQRFPEFCIPRSSRRRPLP